MMRRMIGPRTEPHVPGLRRIRRLLIPQHPDRLIGQVFGEVVTLFRAVGLLDEPVVLDQIGIPLIGLAAEEAVEPVKTLLQRPLRLTAAAGDVLLRHVVVLADPERAVAVVLQHLPDRRALRRCTRGSAGKTVGTLRDRREPVHMMVAAGQETGPGRRAQRGGVPLGVHHPVVGQLLHDRHLDPPAVGRPRRHPGVVIEHHQDVRRAVGCLLQLERLPVRSGIPDIKLDLAVEPLVDTGAVPRRTVPAACRRTGPAGVLRTAAHCERRRCRHPRPGGQATQNLAPGQSRAVSLLVGRFGVIRAVFGHQSTF